MLLRADGHVPSEPPNGKPENAAKPAAFSEQLKLFWKGEAKQPYARSIKDARKMALLGASLIGTDADGKPVSNQQEDGLVSALGNVLIGNCRCELLHAAGLPFRASLRLDIDTPAKELDLVATGDITSPRDPLEKALIALQLLEMLGISQKELAERWNQSPVQMTRLLAPAKMPAPILAAFRTNPKVVTVSHLAKLRKVREEAKQLQFLDRIVKDRLSVADLAGLISPKKPRGEKKSRMIQELLRHGAVLSYPDTLTPEQHKEVRDEAKAKFDKRYEGVKATDLPVSAMPAKSK